MSIKDPISSGVALHLLKLLFINSLLSSLIVTRITTCYSRSVVLDVLQDYDIIYPRTIWGNKGKDTAYSPPVEEMADIHCDKKRYTLENCSEEDHAILAWVNYWLPWRNIAIIYWYLSRDTGKVATIFVGRSEAKYHVDKALISLKSPFFRRAFYGHFEEAKSSEMRLKDVRDIVFEDFKHWLYTSELPTQIETKSQVEEALGLFVFAEQCLVDDLMEKIFRGLVKFFGRRFQDANDKEFIKDALVMAGDSRIRFLVIIAAFSNRSTQAKAIKEVIQENNTFAVGFGQLIMFVSTTPFVSGTLYENMTIGSAQMFLFWVSKIERGT